MSVGSVLDRQDRPAYVSFKTVEVEDKAASLAAGHFVAKSIEYALITPPYSRDRIEIKVTQWLLNMEQDVRNDRLPKEWADRYKEQYRLWKQGLELPPTGTPIKGWGVISPAQQETLIRMNIVTVEDLAGVNDEGLRRIGMGSLELKHKAQGWLKQLHDKGPLTQEIAAVKTRNAHLEAELEALKRIVTELGQQVPRTQAAPAVEDSISADDILPESETKTIHLKKK